MSSAPSDDDSTLTQLAIAAVWLYCLAGVAVGSVWRRARHGGAGPRQGFRPDPRRRTRSVPLRRATRLRAARRAVKPAPTLFVGDTPAASPDVASDAR